MNGDIKEFVKEQKGETSDWITDKFLDILAERIKDLDEQVAFERGVNWGAMELIDKLDEKLKDLEEELDGKVSYVPEVFKVRLELTLPQVGEFETYAQSQGFTVLNYHSVKPSTSPFTLPKFVDFRDVVFYLLPDELWLDLILTVLDDGAI